MASSGPYCLEWTIDRSLTLQLFNGTVSESNPDVIVDWFESDRQTETKHMKTTPGQIISQLPIPGTKEPNNHTVLAAKLDRLFNEVNKDYSTIGLGLGHHKVWDTDALLFLLVASLKRFAHNTKSRKLGTVIICANTPDSFNIAKKHCEDNLGRSGTSIERGSLSKPVTTSPTLNINVIQGRLEDNTADVLVCTIRPDLYTSIGLVGAIQRKSKGQLQRDLNSKYKGRKLKFGEIATFEGSGDLHCKYVFVGALSSDQYKYLEYGLKSVEEFCRDALNDFVTKCLQQAEKLGLTSVAFPAIGDGVGYPVKIIAEQMFESVQMFQSNGTIKTVTFVIYDLDPRTIYEEFKKAERTSAKTSTIYTDSASAECVRRKISHITNRRLTPSSPKQAEDHETQFALSSVASGSRVSLDMKSMNLNGNTSSSHSSTFSPLTASHFEGARPKRQSSLRCFKTFYTPQGIQVNFYQCNVVDAPAECICIPAIKDVLGCSIANAINAEAGKDLSKRAKEKLKAEKGFEVGEVCDTEPGKIKGKQRIVHTVVPEWGIYKPFSESDVMKCETEFSNCIVKSLTHVEKLKIPTMAFSPMSVGQQKIPNDLCAAMYVKAVESYDLLSYSPLKEICFIDKDENELRIIEGAFHDVLQMRKRHPSCYNRAVHIKRVSSTSNTDRYNVSSSSGQSARTNVEPQIYESRKSCADQDPSNPKVINYPYWHFSKPPNKVVASKEFTCWFNKKQKLYVYTDNITSLRNIDMIVCNETPNGKSEGKLVKALSDKFGAGYRMSKEAKFKGKVVSGDVIFCEAPVLSKPKWIAHAVLYLKKDKKNEEERQMKIAEIFTNIFEQAILKGCKSIALPSLGSGKGQADPVYYTERLFEGLLNFCAFKKHTDIFVHLVNINPAITDKAILTVKKNANQSPNVNQFVQPKARLETRLPEWPKGTSSTDLTSNDHGTSNKKYPESKKKLDFSSSIHAATSEKRPPTQDTNTMTQKEPRADIRPAPTGNLKIYDDEGITKNPPKKNYNSKERDYKDDDDNSDLEQSDIDDEENEEAFRQRNISQPEETEEICVICMETVKKQKTLPCGHVFCENCIEQQFTYKEACPTCGQVVGTIEGDQPDGTMTITIDDLTHCAGFEHVGQFIITYSFENGKQGPSHPNPGAIYKGITRKAFLPKNEKGKRICKMLWVAFERRLVFTVGSSRTTGKEGVITWNDIHHKTDPKPNSQFGYPDDSYLDRVTDELKAKGVTEVDIVEVPLENIVRRERQHRR
ncbi:uncharacterized protein LOC128211432 [Mya arenaria]|uniref:uncharacterized protein LOC128211432 n=1 Tax=Mya arenaria TaxID=6604 RepID=UPI0022E3F49C|nr:uncharacterized protein LOC128211432 [Mya arenaria]